MSFISEQVTLTDEIGVVQFDGFLLASTTTDDANRKGQQQWTELEIWVKTDEQGDKSGFVFRSVGKSVVFHSINGCRRGVGIKVSDVSDELADNPTIAVGDLEPCRYCKPPEFDDLESLGVGSIRLEVDRPKVRSCVTARDLVEALRHPPRRNSQGKYDTGELSDVALHLLQEAAKVDSDIKSLFSAVTPI